MSDNLPNLLSEEEVAARGVQMTHENLWREMSKGFPAPFTQHNSVYYWRSDELDAYFAAQRGQK